MAGFYTTFNVFDFNVNNFFTVNNSTVSFGNITANTTAFYVNTTLTSTKITQDDIFIGNTSSNLVINSTSVEISNGDFVATYGIDEINLTDGDLTSKINSSGFSVANDSTGFFTCNATNIRLGATGNLANLTPTRLELGDGTTFFGPAGLSIAGDATMNTTSLTVDFANVAGVTANFSGNAATLTQFGLGRRGTVNASSDANTVLQSDGQWVKPGVYWSQGGRNSSVNQGTLELFWGTDYSKIRIVSWLRPNTQPATLVCKLSDDGEGFTGFNGDYQGVRTVQNGNNFNHNNFTNASQFELSSLVGNTAATGSTVVIEIQNHHGAYSSIQINSGTRIHNDINDFVIYYQNGIISNTSPIQGIQFSFSSGGNIRGYRYSVEVYPE